MPIYADQVFAVYFDLDDGPHLMRVRTANRKTLDEHMGWHEKAFESFKLTKVVGPLKGEDAEYQQLHDQFVEQQRTANPDRPLATDVHPENPTQILFDRRVPNQSIPPAPPAPAATVQTVAPPAAPNPASIPQPQKP